MHLRREKNNKSCIEMTLSHNAVTGCRCHIENPNLCGAGARNDDVECDVNIASGCQCSIIIM